MFGRSLHILEVLTLILFSFVINFQNYFLIFQTFHNRCTSYGQFNFATHLKLVWSCGKGYHFFSFFIPSYCNKEHQINSLLKMKIFFLFILLLAFCLGWKIYFLIFLDLWFCLFFFFFLRWMMYTFKKRKQNIFILKLC